MVNVQSVKASSLHSAQVCLLAAAASAAAGVRVQYIDTGNAFSSHRIAHLFQSLPLLLQVSCRCPALRSIGSTNTMQLGVDCLCHCLQGGAQLHDVLARINVQKAFDAQASIHAQAMC